MAQTRRAKRANRIKTLILKPQMTDKEIEAKEGTYFDGKGFQIINKDADVYGLVNGQKQLLAKFRKNVAQPHLPTLGEFHVSHQSDCCHYVRCGSYGIR